MFVGIGALLIAVLVVLCVAAYKIKAESFEVTAGIWRLVTLSIKIKSLARTDRTNQAHERIAPCDWNPSPRA